jgi:hypothetical protein
MKLSTFRNFAARNASPVIDAFVKGAEKIGWQVVDNDITADAAVIWSVLWNGRMQKNQAIYQQYINSGRPVFVLDVGALIRNKTWKLAIGNINNLGYYGHEMNIDWDRPKKLGLDLDILDKKSNSGKICICLQHTNSQQISHITGLHNWINETVSRLRTHTDRPLVIRPHPRSRFNSQQYRFVYSLDRPEKLVNTYDSFNFVPENYHAIINCNSSPGILAAIQGVRPIVDWTSLAEPVGVKLSDIEKPYTIDRDNWFAAICHTEYTCEELESAQWEKRLRPYLEN